MIGSADGEEGDGAGGNTSAQELLRSLPGVVSHSSTVLLFGRRRDWIGGEGTSERKLTSSLVLLLVVFSLQNGKNYRHIMNSVESVKDFCELSLVKMQEVSLFPFLLVLLFVVASNRVADPFVSCSLFVHEQIMGTDDGKTAYTFLHRDVHEKVDG